MSCGRQRRTRGAIDRTLTGLGHLGLKFKLCTGTPSCEICFPIEPSSASDTTVGSASDLPADRSFSSMASAPPVLRVVITCMIRMMKVSDTVLRSMQTIISQRPFETASRVPVHLAGRNYASGTEYNLRLFMAKTLNLDPETVKGFGQEWNAFTQEHMSDEERRDLFAKFFCLIDWGKKPQRALDMGCG